MKFTEFSLHEDLQKGIEKAGYVECTPVQEQVLKAIIEGRDLYVQSQTGTGKTCAYLTSVIQQLLSRTDVQGKQALVMVPTRELAVQVQEEAEKLCSGSTLKCASFYGGVGYDKQVAALKKGADILIGTPGRVIDLNQGGQMDLANVGFLVIDEADRMFDMGFYPDLRTLIKVLPASEKRQTMLFSATLNSYVKNLAWEYTRDPAEITIAAENITVDEIDQELLHVSSTDKTRLLLGIINSEKPESLIIFCNTKRTCEVIAKRLRINGIETEFIIGDLPQKKRLAIMDKFKSGQVKCLVATDVAARGIDVNDLAMVINYDLPNEAENYVHRIGRTARAGKSGKAYTFCSEQDVYSLPPIERYIEKQIPSRVAEESMMAEDKSKDMYIRTDSYHEEYNDKSEFGRMRQAQYERSGRGKKHGSHGGSKGSGRYSSRNEEAKKEYKRDRRVYNSVDDELLASMSSEERMKHYKEKYAGGANTKASSGNPYENRGKKTNGSYKKNKKDFKKNGKKNNRSVVESKAVQPKKTNEKKSIFGKIKSLFGKKK
ncbi:DEAD/DEAH box helicase [Treponema sp.]|uniref:DEAD/DEAH box helicase n=1 Tax=Treponema sp. TaxID=166 RepID=UPI00298DA32C|nr:DEAD/DEAH box helicase [Treponema sp.]MCQ2242139.1 DEAD/DEAH box helicase [Treponema sp.]